ncbi:cell division protein FtsQ/DivIB [Bombilactobacillus bombi]|uniref:cell division protein FtsQ/DivIB n=1 Tax=Bombilactobacillus bombi TaxID=1303590 RepID=UPI0015E60B3F|nr:cell division protein FtsQ/DivIB [Bombilactobacillus bombi]MBA1434354.1 FtsQ-type POTRA domain-containing protein [Bombilactobacillus bombi]
MNQKKRNNLIFLDNNFKHPKVRKKHKKFKRLFKLSASNVKSYFIIFLVILIAGIGYLFSPLGHVAQISVTGVNYLGEQQIINASGINNESLVVSTLLRQKIICQKIKRQVPLVKNVNYSYTKFNHLQINVKEYQTVGFLLHNNGYYRVLENSRVVPSKLQQPIGNFPVYQDFGNKTSLSKFVQLYLKLSPKLRNDISEIHGQKKTNSKHPYRITLYMNDGNMVVGDVRTLKNKLRYYPQIVQQMPTKGIVNLELGAYSYSFPKKNK